MNYQHKMAWLLIFCITGMTLFSCRKDKGNYNYHDINEGTISGVDSMYTTQRGRVLEISPGLAFTKDDSKDTSKYTYRWVLVDQSAAPATTTLLAVSRDLKWMVNVPATSVKYLIYYTVTEKSTDISWRKQFYLSVVADMADGWAILNDIQGQARLDYFNYHEEADTFSISRMYWLHKVNCC